MVKRCFLLAILFISATLTFASSLKMSYKMEFMPYYLFDQASNSHLFTPNTELNLGGRYTDSSIKSAFVLGVNTANFKDFNFSVEKAYVKVRFINSEYMDSTISIGKMPINWGMGMYYRVGDLLFSSYVDNVELGVYEERCDWTLSFRQNFGSGYVLELAYVPAQDVNHQLGLLFQKSFETTNVLKEIRAGYSYRFDNEQKLFVATDLSLYSVMDMVLGVEMKLLDIKNTILVLNMLKNFNVDILNVERQLSLYLATRCNIYSSLYDIMVGINMTLTDRVNLSITNINKIVSGKYFPYINASCQFKLMNTLVSALGLEVSRGIVGDEWGVGVSLKITHSI